ncbi:secretory carrier-associated membrane protein 2-like isoform 3-T3 [Salvelinus alpinus]
MSGFEDNPFAESYNINPFQDPSVTQVTNADVDHIDQFTSFPDHKTVSLSGPTIPATRIPSQPAVLRQSTEPSPQDFSAEIPMEHRRVCKMLYYLWMFHCVTLFLNLLACLALFTVDTFFGVNFGLSILWLILFAPCSFFCWYRPVYKAFKSDSSFSYFVFFFVFFCQVVVFVFQSMGIPNWGNSGWITSLSAISFNKAVGAFMMVVAYLFTVCAVLSVILLIVVHNQYWRTGASFQKAQQEFSQGVLTNKTFQTAATSAAATAASGAFQGNN